MKKKIIVALMAMTIAFSAVACTSANTADATTQEASVEATVEATTEETTESADAASSENSVEAQAAEVVEDAEALEADLEENAIPALGKVDGTNYTNEYFGLQIALEDGYQFADEEMLSTVYGYATDVLSETDNKAVAKSLESGDAQIVALGYNDAGNTVNVTVQQNVVLANAFFDEKAVITMSMPSVMQALEAQGIENVKTDITEEEIAGETHTVLKISGEVQGVGYFCKMVNIQKGNYMLAIGISSFIDDQTDAMFSMITPLQ